MHVVNYHGLDLTVVWSFDNNCGTGVKPGQNQIITNTICRIRQNNAQYADQKQIRLWNMKIILK